MIYDNEDAMESNTSKDMNTLADLREMVIKFPLEDADCKYSTLMKEFDYVKYCPTDKVQGFLIFYIQNLSKYKITTCSLASAKILQGLWKNGCFEILEEKA